ncbi:unnamed protein product [Closterium sp. NIES-53]
MRRWHQVTGQRLLERYGMTEFGMALTNPLLGEKKSGSVGVPLRGVKVKLADTAKAMESNASSSSSSSNRSHAESLVCSRGDEHERTRENSTTDLWYPPRLHLYSCPQVKLADTAKDRHSSSNSTGTAPAMVGHLSAPGAFSSSSSSSSSGGGSSGGGSSVDSSSASSGSGTWSGGWGELLVKSSGMFLRYWNRPQETAEAFNPQGWFRTGDIASVDSHGYWQIHGRASVDIIKTRGFKVSALEIESKLLENPLISETAVLGLGAVSSRHVAPLIFETVVLGVPDRQQGEAEPCEAPHDKTPFLPPAFSPFPLTLTPSSQHPLISEAAVLGVPERQQGEAVAAVVVLGAAQQQHHTQGQRHGATGGGDTGGGVTETSEAAPGEHAAITLDELRKWATPRMAHYKVPSRLRVVATMPRNAMGKVRQQQEHGMQHAMQ